MASGSEVVRLEERLVELHRRALEAAVKMSEEERRLIKDLVESSYRIVYLGYIPAYYRASNKEGQAF